MDLGDGFPKFVANQSVGIKVWIFHNASAARQRKFGWQAFLWDAWMKYKMVSNPKSLKKHDTVYHFDPSQLVLELINLRKSFPNNLILPQVLYSI